VSAATEVEGLLRELAPQVLGALVRGYGDFHTCEDAVQEALLAAAGEWHNEGVRANPQGVVDQSRVTATHRTVAQ
jgi:predicted RNA polymerase sigma factor